MKSIKIHGESIQFGDLPIESEYSHQMVCMRCLPSFSTQLGLFCLKQAQQTNTNCVETKVDNTLHTNQCVHPLSYLLVKQCGSLLTLSLTFSSVWKKGKCSPSFVTLCLISCALTCASMIWLFLMSPTLNIRQGTPSRWLITACLENINVCVRFFGLDNLANTTPTMNAWIITPERVV